MQEINDHWLSTKELCKYLGVCNNIVHKWIKYNEMPAYKMGRLWKFKKEQVDAWLKAGGASKKQ
jgi:excisionase family DNA binding protein